MWRCNCVQNEALFSLSSFLSYLIKNISVGSERKNQDPTKFFILSTLQSNTHKNHSLSLSLSPNKWTLIDFCKQIKPWSCKHTKLNLCGVRGPKRTKTWNVSHKHACRSVSAPRTSFTRAWEGIRSSPSWKSVWKRKDHEKGSDGGRKLFGEVYLPPSH